MSTLAYNLLIYIRNPVEWLTENYSRSVRTIQKGKGEILMTILSSTKTVSRRLTGMLSAVFVLAAMGAVGCEYYPQGEDSGVEAVPSEVQGQGVEDDRVGRIENQIKELQDQAGSPAPAVAGDDEVESVQINALEEPVDVPSREVEGEAPIGFQDDLAEGTQEEDNQTSLPTACTPPAYNDGRTAVPLVMTAYERASGEGIKARFVSDTPYVNLNDNFSLIDVARGPNYVEGDKVVFYRDLNFSGRRLELGPGSYSMSRLSLVGPDGAQDADNQVSSLKIVRGNTAAKECADTTSGGSPVWDREIHLIAAVYDHPNKGGESQQIIFDTANLAGWGANDNASSLVISKGPHYQEGDTVHFFQHPDGRGRSLGMPQVSRQGYDPWEIDHLEAGMWGLNDAITSVYFYHGSERIYDAAE